MQEHNNVNRPPQEKEIDLGVFFSLIGSAFNKIGVAISLLFRIFFNLILSILLFIKRKLVWIALGALIGLGFGLKQYLQKGPSFFSDMTVRTNFESARLLYNQVDYFNSLIDQDRVNDLSALFKISKEEAEKLIKFTIVPVDDELEVAKLYRNTFLESRKRNVNANVTDTIWSKMIKFEDFKSDLAPYNFPLQEIRVYSSSANVYNKIGAGIVQAVLNDQTLQKIKAGTTSMYNEEVALLNRSLVGLDSLRQAYNKRIAGATATNSEKGNNVFVADQQMRNPEIDLYEKELILKDELIEARSKIIEQSDVLQVYSNFNATGTKSSGFNQEFTKYTWIGALIAVCLLILIEGFKYLQVLDKKKQTI